MSWSRERIEMLAEHERGVLRAARALEPDEEHIFVQPPGGGRGVEIECMRVIGYGDQARTFRCKRIDESGAVTGDEIEVYAFSLEFSDSGQSQRIGLEDLTQCQPLYLPGVEIRVQRQRNLLASGWVAGYFAVDTFVRGC